MIVKVVEETSELPTVDTSDYSSKILTESPTIQITEIIEKMAPPTIVKTEATKEIMTEMPFKIKKVVTEKLEHYSALPTVPTSQTIMEAATVPIKVLKEMNTQTTVASTETTAEISTNLPGISEATTKITSNLTASTVNIVIERSDISTGIHPWDTSVPTTEVETWPITLFHDKAVPTSVICS